MEWTPVNLNATARVKLTPRGYQVYENHMVQLNQLGAAQPLIPKVDPDGWYQDQLWSIANIFGAALYNGCDVPFEIEIQVCLKNE